MAAGTNPQLRALAKETCRALRKNQTPAEAKLWDVLRDRQFHGLKVYRQYPLFVDDVDTETFFVADLFCFERRLVIEVDGRIHDYRSDHDRLRTYLINQLGIRVLRLRNEDIERNLDGVLEEIARAISSQPKEGPKPSDS